MTAYTATHTVGNHPAPPGNGENTARPSDDSAAVALEQIRRVATAITDSAERAIEGKRHVITLAVAVMLAGGHLLIEDVPGVGKTTLAKALAKSIGGSIRRIQFTPDLLPSDVIGVSIYNQVTRDFEFKPGAIFSHILVADEINRASPKTQSALLECMEEHQVTVDGTTYQLENPFMVVATQNPIEMEGTYPLPEAQRDRFTARIAMGYPDANAELAMLDEHTDIDPLVAMRAVSSPGEIQALTTALGGVYVSTAVKQYVVNLVSATRATPQIQLGASPRAALQLLRTARAIAALHGRDFVLPDDVRSLATPVLAHRLLLDADVRAAGQSAADVLSRLIALTPVPDGRNRK